MRDGAFNQAFEVTHLYSPSLGRWVPEVQGVMNKDVCMEFKSNTRLGIWNSTALFCLDHIMARRRREYAVQIAGKTDILIAVEAHGQDGSQMVLVELLSRSHRLFYFLGVHKLAVVFFFVFATQLLIRAAYQDLYVLIQEELSVSGLTL